MSTPSSRDHPPTVTVIPKSFNLIGNHGDTSRALVPAQSDAKTATRKAPDKLADGGAVDHFLAVVKQLFGGLSLGQVKPGRNSDITLLGGEGEVTVSGTTPNGITMTARKKFFGRTVRWIRLWPYVVIILALATAILLVLRGDQILKILAVLPT